MYEILDSPLFRRRKRKLIEKNTLLEKSLAKAIKKLSQDPFYKGLGTHKVFSKSCKAWLWSSWVSGDVRILWRFGEKKELVIILLDLGKHDSVYV